MSLIEFFIEGDLGKISGELTRSTVPIISTKQRKRFLSQSSATLDLAAVSKVDTAGLSWLFVLVEEAKVKNCQLKFFNASTELIKLAALSSVDNLLPIE